VAGDSDFGGAVTIENTGDSTEALQVRDSFGNSIMQAATPNNRIVFNVQGWADLDYSREDHGYASDSQESAVACKSMLNCNVSQTGTYVRTTVNNPDAPTCSIFDSLTAQIDTTTTANTANSSYNSIYAGSYINGSGSLNQLSGAA